MATDEISYTKAILRIEAIIQQIENEELDVDKLSDRVKEAAILLRVCKEKLYKTEKEVEKILNEIND